MSAEDSKFPRWTPERLRKYIGFEKYSDQEAEKAIDTLKRMARILLSIYKDNVELNGEFGDSTGLWKRQKKIKDG